jgi:glycosyltransferase involved in cell wall biosynthesis
VLVGRGVPNEKTFISMNVPDPRIFQSTADAAPAPDDGKLDLVYHGTMAHRLGVDLLIHSVARIRERVPAVTLHLWGHGDDLEAFQALASELQLTEHVSFQPGGYPLRELPTRLRAMHLGVIGNRRSPAGMLMLPVKLLEYVSLGIPTIVPRLDAIVHYFTDDMVTYYEPESVDSLADAILRLHADPDLRGRQASSARHFLERYGWKHQGQELVAMYRTLFES